MTLAVFPAAGIAAAVAAADLQQSPYRHPVPPSLPRTISETGFFALSLYPSATTRCSSARRQPRPHKHFCLSPRLKDACSGPDAWTTKKRDGDLRGNRALPPTTADTMRCLYFGRHDKKLVGGLPQLIAAEGADRSAPCAMLCEGPALHQSPTTVVVSRRRLPMMPPLCTMTSSLLHHPVPRHHAVDGRLPRSHHLLPLHLGRRGQRQQHQHNIACVCHVRL